MSANSVRRLAPGKKFSVWDSEAWYILRDTTVRSPSDECSPRITGCCYLPDGRLIACDYDNRKVKVCDRSLKIMHELSVEQDLIKNEKQRTYRPYDVAIADDMRVVVSMPLAICLQFIIIKPFVKLDCLVDTKHSCHGIDVHGNKIYAGIHDAGEQDTKANGRSSFYGIKVFSFEGSEILSIPHTGAGSPEFLCLDESGSRIYYAGGYGRKAAITCITTGGKQIFRYSDAILHSPKSVALDKENNLIICDFSNTYVLNETGSSRKYLLSETDNNCWLTCACYNKYNGNILLASKSNEGECSKLKEYCSKSNRTEVSGTCTLQ